MSFVLLLFGIVVWCAVIAAAAYISGWALCYGIKRGGGVVVKREHSDPPLSVPTVKVKGESVSSTESKEEHVKEM